MAEYLVVTADMIESRVVSTTQLVTIPAKLKVLDNLLQPLIPSSLFAGDEIQMLFSSKQSLHPYCLLLNVLRGLTPFRFRFGFGIGTIDEPINPSIAQNKGAAFLLARKALEKAKNEKLIAWLNTTNGNGQPEINSCFLLLNALTQRWTAKHWQRFWLYWESRNIYTVAAQEKVSPEAINKFLNNASIRTIIKSYELFENAYKNINPKG